MMPDAEIRQLRHQIQREIDLGPPDWIDQWNLAVLQLIDEVLMHRARVAPHDLDARMWHERRLNGEVHQG